MNPHSIFNRFPAVSDARPGDRRAAETGLSGNPVFSDKPTSFSLPRHGLTKVDQSAIIWLKMRPSLVRNTLLSPSCFDRIAALPAPEEACAALVDIITKFGQMKEFASEIHTELHLVKPILKLLGFAFDTKPKFFEEHVKGADFALFRSEQELAKSSSQWGTRSYYENLLGLVLVKRYGRNLEEGISGFFLDFENRIPLYQAMYLTKTSGVPWGILTNGKNWLLLKRPFAYEKPLLEIDLEQSVRSNDEKEILLFYHIFSLTGLLNTVPDFLEKERVAQIELLKQEKSSLARTLGPGLTKAEVFAATGPLFGRLFPDVVLSITEQTAKEAGGVTPLRRPGKAFPIKSFDQSAVFAYLLSKTASAELPLLDEHLLGAIKEDSTKEGLLSLKILDLTPGFGNLAIQLLETIAYLSFSLPYREKHSFVAEWEKEALLHAYILDCVLYGTERWAFALDVLQGAMQSRFNARAANYRLGNPLLGMSMAELHAFSDSKQQTNLFSRDPHEVLSELKETCRLYFSLSDRIKEDAAIKSELEQELLVYRRRVKEAMNLVTASNLGKSLESKKIKELLYYMDADEAIWEATRAMSWFREAEEAAESNGFFHMEVEFPFLLNDRFDLIFVQPALNYVWEEAIPLQEAIKAYVKRAMTFLAENGKIILAGGTAEVFVPELKKSRRYSVEVEKGYVTVRRR